MNRLKLRKKLAVFISFMLIMQMVLGNVAFAAEDNEGGTTQNTVTAPTVTIRVANLKDGDNYRGSVKYRIKKSGNNSNSGEFISIDNSEFKIEEGSTDWYSYSPTIENLAKDDVIEVTYVSEENYNLDSAQCNVYTNGQQLTNVSPNNGVIEVTLSENTPYQINGGFQNARGDSPIQESSTPLNLTIGNISVISEGNVTANRVDGLNVISDDNNNNQGTNYRNYGYKIILTNKSVNLEDGFKFTGNGRVELCILYEEDNYTNDANLTIGATDGYSIYDTNGIDLEISGEWNSTLTLKGGIYTSDRIKVSDIVSATIGDNTTPTTKGIVGNSNSEVIFEVNTTMYTSDKAIYNIRKITACSAGTVKINSSKAGAREDNKASIVENIESIYVEDGGSIEVTTTGNNSKIGLALPNGEGTNSVFKAGHYDYDKGTKVEGVTGIIEVDSRDTQEEVNCTQSNGVEDNNGMYKLTYESEVAKNFKLESTAKKLISIMWNDGESAAGQGDTSVVNGTFKVNAAKGIKRNNGDGKFDYLFEQGTDVTFTLLPNPGYEYDGHSFSFNGGNGDVGTIGTKTGEYTYKVGDRPVHVSCTFVKTDSTTTGSVENISSSSIVNTSNESGTLELALSESSDSNKQGIASYVESNDNMTDVEVGQSLDLKLSQKVKKIGADTNTDEPYWTNNLEEIEKDVTITLGLDTELQGKDKYTIIREHTTSNEKSGTPKTEYETIEPEIDRANNTITFKTNKFSTYAIAYKGTYTPSTQKPISAPITPSTPTPTPEPTPAPTVEPTKAQVTPSMAPVSEEVSTSVNNEVNTVVEDITKGTENTAVDSTTADKIKEAVKEGKEIATEIVSDTVKKEEVVTTEVKKIEEEIKSIATKNTSTTKQSFVNIAQYINLEIVIKAGEEKLGNLTQLKEPVEFTIAVPEKLKVKNRKFFVIRVHNGVFEILDTVTNKDGTLSFETDRFSTYALAYEDEVAKPAVVKKVKLATRGTNSLKISWDKVMGATGYRVYVVKDGKWTRVDETKLNTYIYKNLSAGKSYKFAVRPYKVVNGKTIWANTYTPLTTCTKPALVKSIKATTSKRTYVTTTWSKVAGASRYRVYIVKGGKWVRLGTTKYNKFTFKGLKKNTKYKIAVRPVKLDGKTEVLAYTYTASYIKTKK